MNHVGQRHGEPATATAAGPRDLPGALLALGFVVLLLASEAALSLPDETASDATAATFYTQRRTAIVVLQLMGLAAAALLAAYSARPRHVDPVVGDAGLATAVLACAPGLVTLVLALIADVANPSAAGTWNALEPRPDDLLFVGITVFGATVATGSCEGRRGRSRGMFSRSCCWKLETPMARIFPAPTMCAG
jgi:hypothetical protein